MILFKRIKQMNCRASILILTLLMSTTATLLHAAEPSQRNVEYAKVGEHELLLDFYAAKSDGPAPLIIWVHGGAWRSGSKDDVPIASMVDRGFAIASVDYRLSPVAQFPAQIHDIKAAIRYMRGHAEKYSVDPNRFVIAGASAGGHLAALVGVTSGVTELEGDIGSHASTSSQVQAVVSFYGASNLQSILSQSTPHGLKVRVPALQLLFGGQPEDKPQLARLAGPVTHVDKGDPPLLLIHGDRDMQMPLEQAHELDRAYQQAKLRITLHIVEGGGHGGPDFYTPEMLNVVADFLKDALAE